LNPGELIFLDEGMLSCPFHIIRAFMGYFQFCPHSLSKVALGHPEEFIHIQGRGDNVLG